MLDYIDEVQSRVFDRRTLPNPYEPLSLCFLCFQHFASLCLTLSFTSALRASTRRVGPRLSALTFVSDRLSTRSDRARTRPRAARHAPRSTRKPPQLQRFRRLRYSSSNWPCKHVSAITKHVITIDGARRARRRARRLREFRPIAARPPSPEPRCSAECSIEYREYSLGKILLFFKSRFSDAIINRIQ